MLVAFLFDDVNGDRKGLTLMLLCRDLALGVVCKVQTCHLFPFRVIGVETFLPLAPVAFDKLGL